jgi:hypothetical protein
MAITFVGSNTGEHHGGAFGLNLSLPASIQNDLVVVFSASQDETKGGPPSTAGYTAIADLLHPSLDCRLYVSYKFMGATPDTQVSFPAAASTPVDNMVVIVMVFRGVHATLLDTTITTASGTTGSADAPAITPAHADCCIVIAGAAPALTGSPGSVNSYLPTPAVKQTGTVSDATGRVTISSAYRILVGGISVQNPTAWSNWVPGSLGYVALTIALRPITTTTDFVTVDKSTITRAGKTVTLLETIPVSRGAVGYVGKTITTPDATVESVFVDAAHITRTGQTVEPTDLIRGIDVTQASVLCRGRTVTPRDIVFEDIPRYAIKGRASGHWMETR